MTTTRYSWLAGRGDECDLQVDDPYVSPRHALIWLDDNGDPWVEDLGSSNGTYVNKVRVTRPTRLHPGDLLSLGLRSGIKLPDFRGSA